MLHTHEVAGSSPVSPTILRSCGATDGTPRSFVKATDGMPRSFAKATDGMPENLCATA